VQNLPELREVDPEIAFMSLFAVPGLELRVEDTRGDIDADSTGTIILRTRAWISLPRSSVHPAIWMVAFSRLVSFRSTATVGRLEMTGPATCGCAVENSWHAVADACSRQKPRAVKPVVERHRRLDFLGVAHGATKFLSSSE
jgi:hypothetical protein